MVFKLYAGLMNAVKIPKNDKRKVKEKSHNITFSLKNDRSVIVPKKIPYPLIEFLVGDLRSEWIAVKVSSRVYFELLTSWGLDWMDKLVNAQESTRWSELFIESDIRIESNLACSFKDSLDASHCGRRINGRKNDRKNRIRLIFTKVLILTILTCDLKERW